MEAPMQLVPARSKDIKHDKVVIDGTLQDAIDAYEP